MMEMKTTQDTTDVGPRSSSLPDKGKILVVLSSADHVTFADGKTEPTGFFLEELCTPLAAILESGWTVDFANPKGSQAVTDPVSMSTLAYLTSLSTRTEHKKLLERMKFESNFANPKKLSDIGDAEVHSYSGIFVPGGHAPLEDLHDDQDLGRILRHFHDNGKPTGLLGHGSIALVSAGDPTDHTIRFPWASYRMTGYSNSAELMNEIKWMHKLKIHVETELSKHGGLFKTNVLPNTSHIEDDRELVTGQNPASASAFAEAFVKKLDQYLEAKNKATWYSAVAMRDMPVLTAA